MNMKWGDDEIALIKNPKPRTKSRINIFSINEIDFDVLSLENLNYTLTSLASSPKFTF